jgi:cystathionine beta-lyase
MPVADTSLSAELERLRALSGIKWSRYPEGTLACWVADMDLPPPPAVVEALRALVERGDFGYHMAAHAELPRAWARWMEGRHGWRPDPSLARVFTDVLQVVDLALWLGTRPGDGVVVFTPVYPPFLRMVPAIGRRVVECPLDPPRWRLDPERLAASVDEGTRAVLLCNPHNPTGRAFTAEELRSVAEVAARHDLLVISDEIWADVVFSGFRHLPFASLPEADGVRTVTAHAASKAFNLAGLRCAVGHVGDREIGRRMADLPAHLLGGVGSPGAIATLAAWSAGGEWLDATVPFLEGQRDRLARLLSERLPMARSTPPEATYLAWIDFRGYALGDDPAAALLEKGKVALNPGPDFGENGKGFGRLNFAASRVVLDEAVRRIMEVLR